MTIYKYIIIIYKLYLILLKWIIQRVRDKTVKRYKDFIYID